MDKIKEIAEKSEGRVIIATLPKREFTEPTDKGKEKKEPNAPAKTQDKPKAPKVQDKPEKTIEQKKAEFDRLNRLFYRQRCFEGAIKRINEYGESLAADTPNELESKNFRLILGSGYSNEDLKITNREVIADTLSYLSARIENTIEEIQTEILNG
jgi:hypothetical protein